MINDIKGEIERKTGLPANVVDQVVNALGEIVSERYPQYAGMIGPILGIPMGGTSGTTGTAGATGATSTTSTTGTTGTTGTAGTTGSTGTPDLGALAGEIGGLFGGKSTNEPGTGSPGGGSTTPSSS